MMNKFGLYDKTGYTNSHALVIGINNYPKQPLEGCVPGAEVVSNIIKSQYGFSKVDLLLEEKATKGNILSSLYSYRGCSKRDDRIFFFFAGHGCQEKNYHNVGCDIGYIVPVDGDPERPETLVRLTELVEITDTIPAKHILLVIDACYSGSIITRTRGGEQTRGMQDALANHVRQAITSGLSNQVVGDTDGHHSNQSRFTSSLIDGLDGAKALCGGREELTASGLAIFVVGEVGSKVGSFHTPSYGKLSGEGDFVFGPVKIDPASVAGRHPTLVEATWGERAPDDYILEQQNLDILFKDGYSFFEQRGDLIKKRLSDPKKRTRVAIVHPDFVHIDAVGDMDAAKTGEVGLQRKDCISAVASLKRIADSARTTHYDPTEENAFFGFHAVPTWNGFLGDREGYVSMYFTRAYRGKLNTFFCEDVENGFLSSIREDFDMLSRKSGLNPSDDLWNYPIGNEGG